jgi:hypothetical protein
MPTKDQVAAISDLLVEIMLKAKAARDQALVGDQDYYTKRVSELAQAAHDDAEEALGFLRLTQVLPPEKKKVPMNAKVRGSGASPTARPTLRGKSVRPPAKGRGR